MSYPTGPNLKGQENGLLKCHGHRSTTSTIDAAVAMRDMSKNKPERLRLLLLIWNAKLDTDLPASIET
jgi:hypothetical protein